MDGAVLGLFLLTTFVGGVVTGLAGFAMGLVVSGVWLHILTPAQTAMLIVTYGLVTQTYTIWRIRHALRWRVVMPFVAGGIVGVPLGTLLLTYLNPAYVRTGVGVMLIAYSTYFLARPHFKPMHAGIGADVGIGVVNGILGGMTGLSGPIITVWCQMRGWSRDEQRAIFQPVILAAFVLTTVSLAIAGTVTPDLVKLYIYGLPALVVGLWLGLHLYGHLDENAFRKVILILLLLSGLALIVPFH